MIYLHIPNEGFASKFEILILRDYISFYQWFKTFHFSVSKAFQEYFLHKYSPLILIFVTISL